jgi:hypothetical protein
VEDAEAPEVLRCPTEGPWICRRRRRRGPEPPPYGCGEHDNPVLIAAALKSAVEAAVVALKTFELVFPERFAIVGLDREFRFLWMA